MTKIFLKVLDRNINICYYMYTNNNVINISRQKSTIKKIVLFVL
uniref:Uncharacterized protein n=1 Tax=Siphoviridae sp. ctLqe90 TaxID=2825456 RepID=A0A8S5Q391_9CAUD|nr:MAG TPA: hypothetical protein [Siphoviridae sp. ctLqe90]DAG35985.1 MAG TPA: hypothetical protein [Caudoviricetes sp.]